MVNPSSTDCGAENNVYSRTLKSFQHFGPFFMRIPPLPPLLLSLPLVFLLQPSPEKTKTTNLAFHSIFISWTLLCMYVTTLVYYNVSYA